MHSLKAMTLLFSPISDIISAYILNLFLLSLHYILHLSSSIGIEMGVLVTVAKHMDTFIGPVVMLIYPLYASTRAIESPSPVDDQQWLTYWVLYSLITLFELSFWRILQWFPLWPYLKLVACIWLVLPAFNGAAYIYANHVRSYVKNYGKWSYPERQRRVMQLLSLDARKTVERYIENHGTDAFMQLIDTAEREARSQMK